MGTTVTNTLKCEMALGLFSGQRLEERRHMLTVARIALKGQLAVLGGCHMEMRNVVMATKGKISLLESGETWLNYVLICFVCVYV